MRQSDHVLFCLFVFLIMIVEESVGISTVVDLLEFLFILEST